MCLEVSGLEQNINCGYFSINEAISIMKQFWSSIDGKGLVFSSVSKSLLSLMIVFEVDIVDVSEVDGDLSIEVASLVG